MSLIAVASALHPSEIRSRRDGRSVAVLVDSENFPSAFLGRVVEAAEEIGRANIRKGFANCSSSNTQEWRNSPYAAFAVTPIHIPTTTSGKNASDIALAMAAMDIAHLRLAEVICIASSDGDFAMLAHRLRELGVSVVGFGSSRAPAAWVAACDHFEVVYTLETATERGRRGEARSSAADPAASPAQAADKHVAPVVAAVDAWMGPSSERSLGPLGTVLKGAIEDFDPRNYGYGQLRKLVHSLPGFEVVPGPKGSPNSPRVRRTAQAAAATDVAEAQPPEATEDEATVEASTEAHAAGEALQEAGVAGDELAAFASMVEEFMGGATERDYSQLGLFLRRREKGFTPRRYGHRQLRSLVSSLDGFDVETVGIAGNKPILRLLRVSGEETDAPVGGDGAERSAGPRPLETSVPIMPDETGPDERAARSNDGEERRREVFAAAAELVAADPAASPRQLWARLRARFATLTLAELGVESVRQLLDSLPEPAAAASAPAPEPTPPPAEEEAAVKPARRPRRRAARKAQGPE